MTMLERGTIAKADEHQPVPASRLWDSVAEELGPSQHKVQAGNETQQLENRLVSDARQNLSNEDARADFVADLQQFKQRVAQEELPDSEYTKTVEQLCQLMEAKTGKVSSEYRTLAAQGIIHNAACPDLVRQSFHPTCNVTTIEHLLYVKDPAQVASMVVSAELTGQWQSASGKTIYIPQDSLPPSQWEKNFPPQYGRDPLCTYASKVAQVLLLNDLGQNLKPELSYHQVEVIGPDSGGADYVDPRLREANYWQLKDGTKIDFWQPGSGPLADAGVTSRTGGPTCCEVAAEVYRVTGQKYGVAVNRQLDLDNPLGEENRPPGVTDDNLLDIRTSRQLETAIRELKHTGKLPLVVGVNGSAIGEVVQAGHRTGRLTAATSGSLIFKDGHVGDAHRGFELSYPAPASGLYHDPDLFNDYRPNAMVETLFADDSGVGPINHVVTVDDYRPAYGDKPAAVLIHNQSRKEADGWISIGDLAFAMKVDD